MIGGVLFPNRLLMNVHMSLKKQILRGEINDEWENLEAEANLDF